LLVHLAHARVCTPNYDYKKLGISPLPPSIDTGINFVDKTNAASFIPGAS
jgi:hypothetical protein